VGLSAGVGIGGGGSAGTGIGGGVAAGAAFAELRASAPTARAPSASGALLSTSARAGSSGPGASFAVGGQAQKQQGASLGADDHGAGDVNTVIRFG
jgi:hypothetical protein